LFRGKTGFPWEGKGVYKAQGVALSAVKGQFNQNHKQRRRELPPRRAAHQEVEEKNLLLQTKTSQAKKEEISGMKRKIRGGPQPKKHSARRQI